MRSLKFKFIKRALLIAILLCGIGYGVWGINTYVHSATAKAKNHEVHLASTIPVSHIRKETPQKYNGQIHKVVYLTFDDGPGPSTSQVLDILKQNHIHATFFVIGPHAEQYKKLVQREIQEENYVGMHSMTHDYKKLYVQGNFVPEMKEVQQIIKRITGIEPHLIRPPYGSKPGLNQNLRDQVVDAHFKIWDWTIDSLDWKYDNVPVSNSVPAIVNNVLSHATRDCEVILMHDIHPQSVQALPSIIQKLKEKGYDFDVYTEQEHVNLNFWHDNRL
jgi:peptidoglycan/xylan/chitin deacetylase (PgdA/CDA1 family)